MSRKDEILSTACSKRLNLILDPVSLQKLEKIKNKHGDATYTQAIKRALALMEFVDESREDGLDLFVGDKKKGELRQVIVAV